MTASTSPSRAAAKPHTLPKGKLDLRHLLKWLRDDGLLKTTEAVRLLGAETILTGISAQIARTVVQLGVDISTMHTRARLEDGIELALALLGRAITTTKAD